MLDLGRQGWALEHFGGDVTILRTRPAPADEPRAASMLLSCAGTDRRFRLVVPTSGGARAIPRGGGSVLIRAFGQPRAAQTYVATRLEVLEGRVLTATSAEPARTADVVLTINRMLVEHARGFDILYRSDPSPGGPKGYAVYRLLLTSERGDEPAFQDFARTCERP